VNCVQVRNIGNATVPESSVLISWPYETASGQHVLYLLDEPATVIHILLPLLILVCHCCMPMTASVHLVLVGRQLRDVVAEMHTNEFRRCTYKVILQSDPF
jgi:Integrin alpha